MSSVTRKASGTLLGENDRLRLQEGTEAMGLQLERSQLDGLFQYAKLIEKWNRVYNLTAIRSANEVITHHLLDSLAVVPKVDAVLTGYAKPHILDVGAGAGLPGLVWAIARPHWQITLVDTVQKKAAFMQQAAASLGLSNARAIHDRVEALRVERTFDLITSRAFSSLKLLIDLSQHLLAENGHYAALKGRVEVDQEVPDPWRIEAVHPIEVPFLDEARHLFVISR